MEWDLGFLGLATLLGMALGFGLLAQLFAGEATSRWLWMIASAVYFVAGLLISEAWFGWATEEDLQPNVDGLSFDETLLALVPGIAAVIIARRMSKAPARGDRGVRGTSTRSQRARRKGARSRRGPHARHLLWRNFRVGR